MTKDDKALVETEADRLHALIHATAQHWLYFQQKHPIPWEGAIDGAMVAACDRIERLTAEVEALQAHVAGLTHERDFHRESADMMGEQIARLQKALDDICIQSNPDWTAARGKPLEALDVIHEYALRGYYGDEFADGFRDSR